MTGWRVGYTAAPKTIIDEMEKLQEHIVSGVTALAQRAALSAITSPQDCVHEMADKYDKRRCFVYEGLNAIDGMTCIKPESIFYAFPNISSTGLSSWDLAKYLAKEHKVAVVPGSISFAESMKQLEEGIERIGRGMAALG
jgi:aspartate/methionine/tyrosine aminotransferase